MLFHMMFPLTHNNSKDTEISFSEEYREVYVCFSGVQVEHLSSVLLYTSMLSCTSKNVSSRLREVSISHCWASEKPHQECCAQFEASQDGREMDRLKPVQWKATKVVGAAAHDIQEQIWVCPAWTKGE